MKQPIVVPQHSRELRARWSRALALATAGAFLLSSAFPVVAGLSKDTASFPRWWGIVDVTLAFVLAVLALGTMALAENGMNRAATDATYRVYRVLIHGILLMIVVFFSMGDRIVWINCLTGFAWRAWLLLYCLPAWLVAFETKAVRDVHGPEPGSDHVGP